MNLIKDIFVSSRSSKSAAGKSGIERGRGLRATSRSVDLVSGNGARPVN